MSSGVMKNDDKPASSSKYDIKKLDTAKNDLPMTTGMKEGVISRYPSSTLISGASGSGKTQLLLNILTNKQLCGGFYHTIVIFSPTAGQEDDTYKILKVPEENFIKDFTRDQLDAIINMRRSMIKARGIEWTAQHCRMAIILDDIIANRSFLESPECLKCFALLRHYLVSIYVLIQSFNKVPRAIRLNCNNVFVFPSTESEIEVLIKEIRPAGMSKKDFRRLIEYCTEKKYDFMAINRHADTGQQIRKRLTQIVNMADFKTNK